MLAWSPTRREETVEHMRRRRARVERKVSRGKGKTHGKQEHRARPPSQPVVGARAK